MTTKNFEISGMSCGHCVKAVEKELSTLKTASYEVEIGKAKVNFDENEVSESQIKETIEEAGYSVTSVN